MDLVDPTWALAHDCYSTPTLVSEQSVWVKYQCPYYSMGHQSCRWGVYHMTGVNISLGSVCVDVRYGWVLDMKLEISGGASQAPQWLLLSFGTAGWSWDDAWSHSGFCSLSTWELCKWTGNKGSLWSNQRGMRCPGESQEAPAGEWGQGCEPDGPNLGNYAEL